MINKKRELLKLLSVAGATGAAWKQPVVNSVLLPVHASASLRCVTDSDADALVYCDCLGAPSEELFIACLAESGLMLDEVECGLIRLVCEE